MTRDVQFDQILKVENLNKYKIPIWVKFAWETIIEIYGDKQDALIPYHEWSGESAFSRHKVRNSISFDTLSGLLLWQLSCHK